MIRFSFLVLLLAGMGTAPAAAAETGCEELNRLYWNRYLDDFSIDEASFEVYAIPDGGFSCDGTDRNFILARAINDLERLRPQPGESLPDYYAIVSRIMRTPGNALRYIPSLRNRPDSSAATFVDGELASIFVLDALVNSAERIRPTYTLVHEAFHLPATQADGTTKLADPGHAVCAKGINRGRAVCDERLTSLETLGEGSGNSREFLFLLHLRDHPRADPIMKREAAEQLRYLARHLFNEVDAEFLHGLDIEME